MGDHEGGLQEEKDMTGSSSADVGEYKVELPMELWTLVLQKLPEGDRLQATQVSRGFRAAERGCDRRVELRLGTTAKYRQLRAFAEWARLRTGAVALTLCSQDSELHHDGLLSLSGLGLVPRLTSLELCLNLPVNYAKLASCTSLTALRVAIPRIAGFEYGPDDEHDEELALEMLDECGPEEVKGAVEDSSMFATLMTLAQLLQPAVMRLKRLQSLDVDGLVPPRGDLRVMGLQLPKSSALPWLSRLTQLTRLKARAFNVKKGTLSLPCLRELHVCGGYQAEKIDFDEGDTFKVDGRLTFSGEKLGLVGPQLQLTTLILESCFIQGKKLTLNTVQELQVLRCINGGVYLQVSCPLLRSLRVEVAGSLYDVEGPSDSEPDSEPDSEEEDDKWERRRLALQMTFHQPMPQLTELVLEDGNGEQALSGADEGLIQHARGFTFTLAELMELFG